MYLEITEETEIIKADRNIVCYKILKRVKNIEEVFLKDDLLLPIAMIAGDTLYHKSTIGEWTCCKDIAIIEQYRKNPFYKTEKIPEKYLTLYEHYPVKLGNTHYSKLAKSQNIYFSGNESEISEFLIEDGLFSYIDYDICKERLKYLDDCYTVKCIIPKMAHYCIGRFESLDYYASDALKYVKVIKQNCSAKHFINRIKK